LRINGRESTRRRRYFETYRIVKRKKEELMKNLKEELKRICFKQENDESAFYGRRFLTETDLDEFAAEHGLADENDCYDQGKIESACECGLDYDYDEGHAMHLWGECEVIFEPDDPEITIKGVE